ncbi:hypothetical protein BHE74_00004434 [Ensete ventricosum]|nr:hypothetical protein BHE74_00004434 [Ensete ventricosum]
MSSPPSLLPSSRSDPASKPPPVRCSLRWCSAARDSSKGVECAVCLGELSEGEEARLLLGCNHAFHLHMVLLPLCRSPVVLDTPESANSGLAGSELELFRLLRSGGGDCDSSGHTSTVNLEKKRPRAMSETEQSMGGFGRLSLRTTTGFMVAGVIVCFVLFVLVFFLYLRAKRYWGAIPVSGGGRTRLALAAQPAAGIDAAAIVAALPPVVLRAGDLKEGVECAVCISELSEGEAARLLPRCGHAFHLDCIDMWFCSHSTCPVCRSPAVLEEPEKPDSVAESPRNQDYSGEHSSTSSGSSSGTPPGALVIETPRSTVDGSSSPLPASSLPEEEAISTTTATVRSLRRLLIRGSRVAAASWSPIGHDVEQGHAPIPKAPTSSCH